MEVVLDFEPSNDVCLYNLGITFNLQSNYTKAEDMLKQAIKENPNNFAAFLALGDVLQKQHKTKQAIEVYRELMQAGKVVFGLKEKLKYLEEQYEADLKRQYDEMLQEKLKEVLPVQEEARNVKEEPKRFEKAKMNDEHSLKIKLVEVQLNLDLSEQKIEEQYSDKNFSGISPVQIRDGQQPSFNF